VSLLILPLNEMQVSPSEFLLSEILYSHLTSERETVTLNNIGIIHKYIHTYSFPKSKTMNMKIVISKQQTHR
jgi:hypothetical protein